MRIVSLLAVATFGYSETASAPQMLEVQRFDGKRFTFDDRPHVIMTDHSFVELGSFR